MKFSFTQGLILAVFLTAASISVLLWSLEPPQVKAEELTLKIEGKWLENCYMMLEWTPLVKTGDDVQISFIIGNRINDLIPWNILLAELYPHENLLIEASIELPGENILPQNSYIMPIASEQDVKYEWKVPMKKAGINQGTLWVYMNTVSKIDGTKRHFPILARKFEIESRSILGLNSLSLRLLSVLGIMGGIYLTLKSISSMK